MYKAIVTREQFEEWFLEHPGATLTEICGTFEISISTAYQKRRQFYSKHRYDPQTAKIAAKIYQEGLDHGIVIGSGLGALVGDLAKSKGIGISDLVGKIADWLKNEQQKV